MMLLKVSTLAALIAVSCATLAPLEVGLKVGSEVIDKVKNGGGDDCGSSETKSSGSGLIGNILKSIFGDLEKNKFGSGPCFKSLSNYKEPKSVDDLLDLSLNVGSVISAMVNVNLVPGLGDLIDKVLALSVKAAVCIPSGSYGVCGRDVNGIGPVNKDDDIYELLQKYNLENCENDAWDLVYDKTNNKGPEYWSGSKRNLVDVCLKIAGLLNVDIEVGSLSEILTQLLTGLGSVGNSYHSGYGDNIVDSLLGVVNGLLGGLIGGDSPGVSSSGHCDGSAIKASINVLNDKAPWANKCGSSKD